MASVSDVVKAAGALRDALFGMSELTEDAGAKQFLLQRHVRLQKAMRDFAASPATADPSSQLDGPLATCRNATVVVVALSPAVPGALDRAGAETDLAVGALASVTKRGVLDGLRGTLRIGNRRPSGRVGAATAAAAGGDGPSASGESGQLLAKVTQLFPAEAVSIYPAGAALLKGEQLPTWWFALILAGAVGVVRWVATQPRGGGSPQFAAVVAAVVSYLLWVVMLGDWFLPIGDPGERARAVAAALAFIWVWVAPVLVGKLDGGSEGAD
ncbi:hypothetical protein ACYZX9_14560 [Sphingomonas citri]